MEVTSYNPLLHQRDRSNSPNSEHDVYDLSYMDLDSTDLDHELIIDIKSNKHHHTIRSLLLAYNLLSDLPPSLRSFHNIEILDLSSNQLKTLNLNMRVDLPRLKQFIAKDNLLSDQSLAKDFGNGVLEVVNFSGNNFTQFPYQLLEMHAVREIYLGSNEVKVLPRSYEKLEKLEILYLGGNKIKTVPNELAQLKSLTSLNLSDNLLTLLPVSLANLKKLRTLALHGNGLTTLPIELVKLNLRELSLRNNPLVNRFAKEFTYEVPSLLELSARCIKTKHINIPCNFLPAHLVSYLDSATCCLNPKCRGVYFTSKVAHVKFVDFCGRYRIPLMQYLCSSTCNEKMSHGGRITESSDNESDNGLDNNSKILKKILLG